jgi:hypothetical protein
MEFSYKLGKIIYPNFQFDFNDGRYIEIDLVKDYPNYKLVENNLYNDIWHFTVINDYNSINRKDKGDIENIPYKDIKHFNINTTIVNYKNVTCRKSTQTEYDKYLYKIDQNNDNGRLYKYIYDVIEEDIKKKDLELKKTEDAKFYTIIL